MKLSVSLPEEDVEFLDAFAVEQGFGSRSAVVHRAVRLLRSVEMGGAYEDAWTEWAASDDADAWDAASPDGVGP